MSVFSRSAFDPDEIRVCKKCIKVYIENKVQFFKRRVDALKAREKMGCGAMIAFCKTDLYAVYKPNQVSFTRADLDEYVKTYR